MIKSCFAIIISVSVLLVTATVRADERDFNLPDVNGVNHTLADYRGKWVIINFWATWCPPCREEIPDLVRFHEDHRDKDAVVLGVNYEDVPLGQLNAFVNEYMITYPILRADPAEDTALGMIPGLPTTFMVDPEGKLVARQVGPVTGEMLEDYIESKRNTTAAAPSPERHAAVR